MNFDLSQEQQEIIRRASEFAERHVAPRAAAIDRTGEFPRDLFQAAAAAGLARLNVPVVHGGGGQGVLACVGAIEEVSRHCASSGAILLVHNLLVCEAVGTAGSEHQRNAVLRKLASGEWLGAFALAETEAGSDFSSLQTTAVKTASGYRLSGAKTWVTNGTSADVFVVFAKTGDAALTAFLVERIRGGARVGTRMESLGVCGSGCCELVFDACEIPAENRLGAEGDGIRIAARALDAGRIGVAAQAIGIGRACLEEALDYARTRQQGGQPIGEFQAVQWMLADMATEIDAARLLTWKAASARDQGLACTLEAAVAKLTASEAAVRASGKGMQILGSRGYSRQHAMERFFRDSKVTEIDLGASDIQRLAIAGQILA